VRALLPQNQFMQITSAIQSRKFLCFTTTSGHGTLSMLIIEPNYWNGQGNFFPTRKWISPLKPATTSFLHKCRDGKFIAAFKLIID